MRFHTLGHFFIASTFAALGRATPCPATGRPAISAKAGIIIITTILRIIITCSSNEI